MDPATPWIRWDGGQLSPSSFPRQRLSQISPAYGPPAGDPGPSHHPSWRHSESAADESVGAHHLPGLLQGNPEPTREDRTGHFSSKRTPIVAPKPVLVREYSGNAGNVAGKSSAMIPRRLLKFTMLRSLNPSRPPGPPLPSEHDFSIESILQAIEPDIRSTLDTIAEICGRSKLSLANEYGSHIAPLGEIRASAGGLVPVEEVSSSEERQADEVVTVLGNDPSIEYGSGEVRPFSFYRYLEYLRQGASALEHNDESGALSSAQSNTAARHPNIVRDLKLETLPVTRDIISEPKLSGRDFLARRAIDSVEDPKPLHIATPAMMSETYLDARADSHNSPPPDPINGPNKLNADQWNVPEVVHSLLSWLKKSPQVLGPEARPALHSAESQLRAMLDRAADESTT